MMNLRLYMLQRISALLMAPFVIGHLAVMLYAIQDGLSAGEILGRTQGSLLWFLFYGGFVVAVSVHGAIGLRTVAYEWGGLRGRLLEAFMWAVGAGLLIMGMNAVWGVTYAVSPTVGTGG
ncbi:MAG: succinate dehydrogenase [Pseudomonadota bacterium]